MNSPTRCASGDPDVDPRIVACAIAVLPVFRRLTQSPVSLDVALAFTLRDRALVTTDRHCTPVDESAVQRMRTEFLDWPGLRLTFRQAQRLWSLDNRTCEKALARLVASHFLTQTADGLYVRPSEALESLFASTAA